MNETFSKDGDAAMGENWQSVTLSPETLEMIERGRVRRRFLAGLVIGSGVGLYLGLAIAALLSGS